MTSVLAIDPGPSESAYALIDAETRRPTDARKVPNSQLLEALLWTNPGYPDVCAIEMVASYGMAVGKDVFETCVWIGRFQQAVSSPGDVDLIVRHDVKMHHCHNASAKDTNIARALIDRFASGEPNFGKGTKARPGWFHGFAADIWQAYALAVLVADRLESTTKEPS